MLSDGFVESLLGPSDYGGYTLFNTPIFWLLFIVSFYLGWKFLKREQIAIDEKLIVVSIPYLIFGTLIRTFEESNLLPYSLNPLELGFYTHSPGLWIVMFLFIISMVFIFKRTFGANNKEFLVPFGVFGSVLMLIAFAILFFGGIDFGLLITMLFWISVLSFLSIWVANKIIKGFRGNYLNYLAVIGQAIDGVSSVFVMALPRCSEQHFVSGVLLDSVPFLFPIIKIALVILALYLIDKNIETTQNKKFILIALIALEFMTGPRNIWTGIAGNCG